MTFFREETCKFRGISLHRVILHEIPDHISAFHDHIHAGHVEEIKHQNERIDNTKDVFGVLKTEVDNVTESIEGLADKVED